MKRSAFTRRRVLSLDLISGEIKTPTDTPPVPAPKSSRVLVTVHGHPIGSVDIDDLLTEIPIADAVRQAAWAYLFDSITEHLAEDGLEMPSNHEGFAQLSDANHCAIPLHTPPANPPLITVAISTMTNPEPCVATVRRVLANRYPRFEVVVVDNRPKQDETRLLLEETFQDKVRYAPEPKQGLSYARNRGLAEAKGEIVAFIDDDVIVDEHWLNAIALNFVGSPEVACVTGAIVAAEFETPAQAMLEQYGGFNKGTRRQVFDLKENRRSTPLYPFDAGSFGSGANIAMRKSVIKEFGGFATDLGAGTPAHGGEDIDILRRVVASGHTLVYEPAALMWHFHRRTYAALEKQMYRYGVGFSATVMKWLLESPSTAWDVLSRLPAGFRHALSPKSTKNRRKSDYYPRELTSLERIGIVVGPFAYIRSRAQARRK